ncbi:MAG: 4Fe-4S dicluster domain-containing protein [Proteobacteria bacterium]|nr:4Fe-4S dicluster domain-containing protein [Pseudomonadota bacterium]
MDTVHFVIDRPQRWDSAFDPEMTEADVSRLMELRPFSEMDSGKFSMRTPLRGILKNDTRIRRFKHGEIIVRAGDYGSSAFLVLSGRARVVLNPGLPASVLGRRQSRYKSLFQIVAQLWTNPRDPEVRTAAELGQDGSSRTNGKQRGVFLQDVPRILDEHKTATMSAGDFFGEIAALSRAARTSTIFSVGDNTELLEIRWQGLRDLLRFDDHLRHHIDRIYRERTLATHLREIPIFKRLDDEQLKRVIEQTQFGTYGDYDWSGDYKRLAREGTRSPEKETVIAREGDYPNGVVLIRSGFARLSQKFGHGHRTLNYLGAGCEFGLREIAHNWRQRTDAIPFQQTLRVIGYTHVIVVPTPVMEEVVLPTVAEKDLPALFSTEELAGTETSATRRKLDAGAKIGPELMEFLTENRFFNGSSTMVIDLERCTRCDDCVRACATTNENNPRFLRHGHTSGRIMVANSCMHCADPVCLIGCPTGAIHRGQVGGEVIVNQATCIGCSICSNNCPYEAIRMVEIREADGAFMVDKDMRPIVKATKCDLCSDQIGGPACERSCPHGALRRMDMNNLDAFARWLNR